jgi:hypothetical protein
MPRVSSDMRKVLRNILLVELLILLEFQLQELPLNGKKPLPIMQDLIWTLLKIELCLDLTHFTNYQKICCLMHQLLMVRTLQIQVSKILSVQYKKV